MYRDLEHILIFKFLLCLIQINNQPNITKINNYFLKKVIIIDKVIKMHSIVDKNILKNSEQLFLLF